MFGPGGLLSALQGHMGGFNFGPMAGVADRIMPQAMGAVHMPPMPSHQAPNFGYANGQGPSMPPIGRFNFWQQPSPFGRFGGMPQMPGGLPMFGGGMFGGGFPMPGQVRHF